MACQKKQKRDLEFFFFIEAIVRERESILLDALLELWMDCELLCEAATVAKLPALVVAM